MQKNGEWRELNGLRGVAVSIVMLHHFVMALTASHSWERGLFTLLSAGWLGVEIFFVISGFLITKSLIETRDRAHHFRNFYVRRALRILPLYFCLLTCYYLLLFLFPRAISDNLAFPMKRHWYLFWFNLSNGFAWVETRGLGSLAHLWSVAIEEQFYLVWPLVLFYVSKRRHLTLSLTLFAFTLLLRGYAIWAGIDSWAIYVTTPLRLDGLLLGATLFLLFSSDEKRGPHFLFHPLILSTAALALGFTFYFEGPEARSWGMQTFGYLALALLSTGWIYNLVTQREKAIGAWFLNARPFQLIGKYSYACYLLNYPLWFTVNKSGASLWLQSLLGGNNVTFRVLYLTVLFATTILISHFTFVLIERPALGLKKFFSSPKLIMPQADVNASALPQAKAR